MSTKKLTLATQVVLGAVFGTVLVRKHLRAREDFATASSYGSDSVGWDTGDKREREQNGSDTRAAGHRAGRRVMLGGIPEWLRLGVIIFAAAAVPVFIGVTWALTRSDGAQAGRPQINVPARTAPVATDPVAATPTLAQQWQDAHIAFDLDAVRAAADGYAVYFRAYPTTHGELTPLCVHADDPGCAIGKYATSFPTSDGTHAYWYASDGQSITLVAQVSSAPAKDDCPPGLSAPLGNVPVLCVTSRVSSQ